MKKREMFWVLLILALLFVAVLVSGIFYFSLIAGEVGVTGKVVLTEKNETNYINSDSKEAHVCFEPEFCDLNSP